MPRPSRPALRERFDRRQDELVARAARQFARHGYQETTMQQLAASMGMATGALYHYFPGKEEMLTAICDELIEPLLPPAREIVAAEDDPATRLRALVRLWVAHVCARRDHMLVFQQERHIIEVGTGWRGVRARRKAFERLIADQLLEVPTRCAAPVDRFALLGMVNHTAQWYRPRGPLRPEEIADGYVDLLLEA